MAKKKKKAKGSGEGITVTRSQTPALDPDWEDTIPEPVAAAVDDYVKAMRAKNKATEKVRNAKEVCIERMVEHEITAVRIDEGEKILKLGNQTQPEDSKAQEARRSG